MTTKTHLERELKLRLPDEATWAQVCEALGEPTAELRQTNTYFGTRRGIPDGVMVRVREDDAVLEVTAKDRVAVDPGSKSLTTRERTAPLTTEQWISVHRAHRALTALDVPLCMALFEELGEPLFPIGAMVNLRRVFALGGGYLAEVDRTELPGGRFDFEVEVELRSPEHSLEGAVAALSRKLPELGVEGWDASSPKYYRFLTALASRETGPDEPW